MSSAWEKALSILSESYVQDRLRANGDEELAREVSRVISAWTQEDDLLVKRHLGGVLLGGNSPRGTLVDDIEAWKAIYDATQEYLKQHGIGSMTLYRGVSNQRELVVHSVSSFTREKSQAEWYANETGYDDAKVYELKVPAKQIVAIPEVVGPELQQTNVVELGGGSADEVIVAFPMDNMVIRNAKIV